MFNSHFEQLAFTNAIVDRTANELKEILINLTSEIGQLPPFPGAMFTYGIEVEPPKGSNFGCIIVGEKGNLYELILSFDDNALAKNSAPTEIRNEELNLLELDSIEFIPHAYAAIQAVINYLNKGSIRE